MAQQRARVAEASAAHGLPMHKHVIAGAMAGLCEVLVMYPLDVVKTRMQLTTTEGQGMMSLFSEVVKKEGFWNLYRGIPAPVMAEAPKRALKFASNEFYQRKLRESNQGGDLTRLQHVIAGAMAGMTEATVNCPFELVKVRMQAKTNLGVYKDTMDATRQIVGREGILALYNGFEAQLWRNGVWNAAYFGLINAVKLALPKPAVPSKSKDTMRNFIAGFVAGTVATTLNNPFDVVKSRVQNVLPGQERRYNWAWPGMFKVYREEGVKALYKGYVPKVLRLGPGGGIMLVAFEFFAGLLS